MSNIHEIGMNPYPIPDPTVLSVTQKTVQTESVTDNKTLEFFDRFVDQVSPFAEFVEKTVDDDGQVKIVLTMQGTDVSFVYSSREILTEKELSLVFNHDMANCALERLFLSRNNDFTLQRLEWLAGEKGCVSISHQEIAAMLPLRGEQGESRYISNGSLNVDQLMRDFSSIWSKKQQVAEHVDGYSTEYSMPGTFSSIPLSYWFTETLYLEKPSVDHFGQGIKA